MILKSCHDYTNISRTTCTQSYSHGRAHAKLWNNKPYQTTIIFSNTENFFQHNIKAQSTATFYTLISTTAVSGYVMTTICTPAVLHGVRVGLERVDVVEIGLPVLDQASVVGGDHPHVVVTPHHAAHWAVVTLNRAHHKVITSALRNIE